MELETGPSPSPHQQPARPRPRKHPRQDLAFVSITHPDEIKDRPTQRRIHRHVMKDIGLARRRRPRREKIVLKLVSPPGTDDDAAFPASGKHVRNASQVQRPWSPRLELASAILSRSSSSPYADRSFRSHVVSPRARSLLSFLYRADSPMCRTMRSLCFAMALVDESVLHVALAESALYTQTAASSPRKAHETAFALQHYTASVGILHAKLRLATGAFSAGLIGTVLGLASYDLRVHNFARYAMHMTGLQRMVQTCGGVETLESTDLKQFLIWSDLVGSLSLDVPPRFPLSLSLSSAPPLLSHPASLTLTHALTTLQTILPPPLHSICALLSVISLLPTLTASAPPAHWSVGGPVSQALERLVHDALRLPRAHGAEPDLDQDLNIPSSAVSKTTVLSPATALYETLRRAVLLFLAPPVNRLASDRVVDAHQRGRLPGWLRGVPAAWQESWWEGEGMGKLELWVLVVAALVEHVADSGIGMSLSSSSRSSTNSLRDSTTPEVTDRAWLIREIRRAAHRRGLCDWRGVMNAVRAIAWVDGVWGVDALGRLRVEVEAGLVEK